MLPLGILLAATHEAGHDLSPHHGVPIIPTAGNSEGVLCYLKHRPSRNMGHPCLSCPGCPELFCSRELCLTGLPQTRTCPIPLLRLDIKKNYFSGGCGEAQEQGTKRCCRCPIAENIQSQVGPGCDPPDVVEDVHCRGLGLNEIQRSFSTQTTL